MVWASNAPCPIGQPSEAINSGLRSRLNRSELDRNEKRFLAQDFSTDFPRISVPKSTFVRRLVPNRTNGRFQKPAGIQERMVGATGIEPVTPTMSTEGPLNDFNSLGQLEYAEMGRRALVFAAVALHLRATRTSVLSLFLERPHFMVSGEFRWAPIPLAHAKIARVNFHLVPFCSAGYRRNLNWRYYSRDPTSASKPETTSKSSSSMPAWRRRWKVP